MTYDPTNPPVCSCGEYVSECTGHEEPERVADSDDPEQQAFALDDEYTLLPWEIG